MVRWARTLAVLAGLMGLAGVVLAAAGTHEGGGDLARLAAEFLLIHAVGVLALALGALLGLRPYRVWLWSGTFLAGGAVLFSTDLAFIAFKGGRPFPSAAPIGGMLMIVGWLGVVISAGLVRGPYQR